MNHETIAPPDRPIGITDVMDVVSYAVRAIGVRLPAHVDRDDLSASGHLALVQAFERAPHAEGEGAVRAFLLRRVSGAIRDELRRSDAVGRRMRHVLRLVTEANANFEAQHGRQPTLAEVSALIGFTVSQIRGALVRQEETALVEDSDHAMSVVASSGLSPIEEVEHDERFAAVRGLLECLTNGERYVVTRNILDGIGPEEVADELGVSVSRVHKLRATAMARLRDMPAVAQLRH